MIHNMRSPEMQIVCTNFSYTHELQVDDVFIHACMFS